MKPTLTAHETLRLFATLREPVAFYGGSIVGIKYRTADPLCQIQIAEDGKVFEYTRSYTVAGSLPTLGSRLLGNIGQTRAAARLALHGDNIAAELELAAERFEGAAGAAREKLRRARATASIVAHTNHIKDAEAGTAARRQRAAEWCARAAEARQQLAA